MYNEVKLLCNLNFKKLVTETKKHFKNRTLIIVYNVQGSHNNYMVDAFTLEEEENLKNIAKNSLAPHITFIEDEYKFIETIQTFSNIDIVVLNLTRRGSTHNKKTLITSYCDIYDIPCISSSAYTVNLCRNKFHFQQHLIQQTDFGITNFLLNKQNTQKLKKLLNKKVVLKKLQSAGSASLTHESVFILTQEKLDYLLTTYKPDTFTIEEFIEGEEIEVPFYIINGEVFIASPYVLNFNSEILTEKLSLSGDYSMNPFMFSDELIQKIYAAVLFVSKHFYFNYYGRIDFKVSNNAVKIFDIATTPYFLTHSSIAYFINDNSIPASSLDFILFSFISNFH